MLINRSLNRSFDVVEMRDATRSELLCLESIVASRKRLKANVVTGLKQSGALTAQEGDTPCGNKLDIGNFVTDC